MQAAHLPSETVTERIDPSGGVGGRVGRRRSQQRAPLIIAFKITAVAHSSETPRFDLLELDQIRPTVGFTFFTFVTFKKKQTKK